MKKAVLGIIALGLSVLVIYTSLNTGDYYSSASGIIGPWVNAHFFFGRLNLVEERTLMSFGSKFLGHFVLFMLVGLFVYLFVSSCLKKKATWVVYFCYGAFLASLGEILQIFTAGRSPTVADIFINYFGYLLIPLSMAFYRSFNPRLSK